MGNPHHRHRRSHRRRTPRGHAPVPSLRVPLRRPLGVPPPRLPLQARLLLPPLSRPKPQSHPQRLRSQVDQAQPPPFRLLRHGRPRIPRPRPRFDRSRAAAGVPPLRQPPKPDRPNAARRRPPGRHRLQSVVLWAPSGRRRGPAAAGALHAGGENRLHRADEEGEQGGRVRA